MAVRPYSVTVPRGQEHLLPMPVKRRAPITTVGGGLSRAARLAYGKAIEQFAPGGAYGKGVEAALERERKKTVARGQQALVSAGLAGTSMLAAPGQRFAEEVAMPTRARVEETRATRLADLYAMLAGAEQRGYESQLGADVALMRAQPTRPYSPVPTPAPTFGTTTIPAPDFSLPSPARISSALASAVTPGSPADLWRKGLWGKSLESERARAGESGLYGTQYAWAGA